MSTPQPPRRRRIAGESKPGTPASRRPTPKGAIPKVRKTTEKPPPAPPPPRPSGSDQKAGREKAGRRVGLPTIAVRAVSGRRAALVALTVVALFFGGWFGFQGWKDWRGDDVVAAHDKAAATAAASAETIFTYRYDRLDEHLEDAQDTMTKSFATKFETISPALNDLAPQRKIQVKASTRDAAALECGTECDPDKASVLVFIDQARLADGSTEPTVFGNRIQLEMVRQDGTWLVDEIKAL